MSAAETKLRDRIALAFVFGSWAAGASDNLSDVDVMVIGDVTLRDLAPQLRAARQTLNREVNAVTMTATELGERARDGDHFVSAVLDRPMIFLIGGADELGRLAPRGAPAKT